MIVITWLKSMIFQSMLLIILDSHFVYCMYWYFFLFEVDEAAARFKGYNFIRYFSLFHQRLQRNLLITTVT